MYNVAGLVSCNQPPPRASTVRYRTHMFVLFWQLSCSWDPRRGATGQTEGGESLAHQLGGHIFVRAPRLMPRNTPSPSGPPTLTTTPRQKLGNISPHPFLLRGAASRPSQPRGRCSSTTRLTFVGTCVDPQPIHNRQPWRPTMATDTEARAFVPSFRPPPALSVAEPSSCVQLPADPGVAHASPGRRSLSVSIGGLLSSSGGGAALGPSPGGATPANGSPRTVSMHVCSAGMGGGHHAGRPPRPAGSCVAFASLAGAGAGAAGPAHMYVYACFWLC